jgi:1-deoxy-D-xylulose-5-phosphate reductoisomerase
MGQRISIDSASMFNKAMEVLETYVLFDVTPAQIEVIVHPQSIIHSMVGFNDGAIMAHLGPPDMRAPIGFALNWPERADLPVERLEFGTLGALTFQAPDTNQFPSLALAQQTMEMGGLAGAAFNAAKEAALDMFLAREIGFLDMARVVRAVLGQIDADRNGDVTLDAVIAMDATARKISAQAANKGFS